MKAGIKALCAALALLFVISFPANTASDVTFIAVNNTLLRPLSTDTMPIYISGETYIPYTVLSNFTTIKYYYNRTLKQILVYDFWHRITFDLAEGRTFDESGKYYDFNAVSKNGTVYLPLIVISAKFDFYISSSHYSEYGALLRINEGDKIADDRDYTDSVGGLMKRVYNEYAEAQKAKSDSSSDSSSATTNEKPAARISYLILNGDPKACGDRVLSSLGSLNAAFFFTEEQIRSNGGFLRRLISESRTVGIYLEKNADISLTEQLKRANAALKEETFIKSRLVCVDEGSSSLSESERDGLIASGVRIWDPNLTVNGLRSSTIQTRASKIFSTLVFGLDISDPSSLIYLANLKKTAKDFSFSLLHMDEWSTPINGASDIR